MVVSTCNHQVIIVILENLTNMIVTLVFLNNSGSVKIVEKLISFVFGFGQKNY
jgi:hypothetical protein